MREVVPVELIYPKQRIVITGRGCVSPMGDEVQAAMDAVFDGVNGVSLLPEDIREGYKHLGVHTAAQVLDFDITRDSLLNFSPREQLRLHRSTQFALWAGTKALREAGLIDDDHPMVGANGIVEADRVAISMGTGIGGSNRLGELQKVGEAGRLLKPYDILSVLPERVSSALSMRYGIKGPVNGVTAACATGLMNIIRGAELLKLDRADAVLVGGTEAQVNPLSLSLFASIKALDLNEDPEQASRPFHKAEAGFVMGEGSGALVLETLEHAELRGARILAEIISYGETADAYHETAPSGEGAAKALQEAIGKVLINAETSIYVNAHATGTGGDKVELSAIDNAIDRDLIEGVSSTKGAHGHMLGAAGAFETIVCIETLERRMLPPSLKLGVGRENLVEEARDWPINPSHAKPVLPANELLVVNNSFGFGGLNAAIILAK